MLSSRLLFLLAALSLATDLTAGKTYKWVDADGVTQYSQTPPPGESTSAE